LDQPDPLDLDQRAFDRGKSPRDFGYSKSSKLCPTACGSQASAKFTIVLDVLFLFSGVLCVTYLRQLYSHI
jgi:hypothetical protein